MLYHHVSLRSLMLLGISTLLSSITGLAQSYTMPITTNWEFRQSGKSFWMPAKVPGCVHTDLLDNKIIEDPYYRTNEKKQQWIGETNWEYRTRFDVSQDLLNQKYIQLVFEGLDTYADVLLNGEKILHADNMHRTWKIACKDKLKATNNNLHIIFHSVFTDGMAQKAGYPIPLFQYANNDQTTADSMISIFIRKAGYHFGWDWGPRFVTAGIWKPISMEAYNDVHFEDIHISTQSISKTEANMTGNLEIFADEQNTLDFLLTADKLNVYTASIQVKKGWNSIHLNFTIPNPKLWWSNGLGKANLYEFEATLRLQEKIVGEKKVRTGIRTITVENAPDEQGKSLYIKLNGRPVFMKGANYIPMDMFSNRTTKAQYEKLIQTAAAANMNMLRVWGGGYFEKEIFYNLCDEMGILIWQDMLFACGTYPGNAKFYENVTEEIKDNVKRLRNHPCIALYNGNNEVDVAYYAWTWKEKYTAEQQQFYEKTMKTLFGKIVPDAINSVDDTRYYHPTSPNTGYNNIGFENGDVHYWNVWHGKEPFESFNTSVGRFMSEYGFQSYPLLETIKTFTLPNDRTLTSEVMQAHQRCMADDMKDKTYGNRLIKHYMDQYYQEPKDFESYLYVSQLLQKKGLAMAIEAHRRNMPFCMGTLYWQLNDCWPVASWSSVDYEGRWKAAHFKVKELYANQMISVWKAGDSIEIHIVNDANEAISGTLQITMQHLSGKVLQTIKTPVTLKKNTSKIYYKQSLNMLKSGVQDNDCIITATFTMKDKTPIESMYYLTPEKNLPLKKPNIRYKISDDHDTYKIELTSEVFAKDVYLSFPDKKGLFSNNFFDVLPGKKVEIIFTPESGMPLPAKNTIQIFSLYDSYH